MKTLYEYVTRFEDLMDDALNNLSPSAFEKFKDNVSMILEDYEE